MVKLTPELINSSMQYINPCRDRELDLRGKSWIKCNNKTNISDVPKLRLCFDAVVCFHLFYTQTGYKIPQIENMGATLDQFDTVDFSDNDLRRLDGFPYLPRMKCLLLNNNRIMWVDAVTASTRIIRLSDILVIVFVFIVFSRIADNLHEFLPNLESIILTGNNIQEFSDLDPLLTLTKLETLSLLTNPITTKPFYREYIAFK